jgi:hypothetical protein
MIREGVKGSHFEIQAIAVQFFNDLSLDLAVR